MDSDKPGDSRSSIRPIHYIGLIRPNPSSWMPATTLDPRDHDETKVQPSGIATPHAPARHPLLAHSALTRYIH